MSTKVHLVPSDGVSGSQRINFALPLQPGQLTNANNVRVLRGSEELKAGRRALASHPGGSIRSVQIQFDLEVSGESDIEVRLGETPTTEALSCVPVDTTLVAPDGEKGPRVWALLPAAWLIASGVAGRLTPAADDTSSASLAWAKLIARQGIQSDGRPYYFMGVGTTENMPEEYDEHYGESAYLTAMAWFYSGKTDQELRKASDALVVKLGSDGEAPHVRSFNWQCRSAVAGPWYLR